MFWTVAQVQAAPQYMQKLKYYLLKHETTFSLKAESLHVVNNSATAQLHGIKLIQLDIWIKIWCFKNCMPVPSIIVHLKLIYIKT